MELFCSVLSLAESVLEDWWVLALYLLPLSLFHVTSFPVTPREPVSNLPEEAVGCALKGRVILEPVLEGPVDVTGI